MPSNETKSSRGRGEERNRNAPGSGGKHGKDSATSRQSHSEKSVVATQEVLMANRAALITEKQTQLEAVVDRHDTLVREMFHMEHFIMMLGYDPTEAKHDDTQVFQNYKAMYDLVGKAIPGPSRPTRSRRTEQMQILKVSSVSAPVPSTSRVSKPKPKLQTATAILEQPGKGGKAKRKAIFVAPDENNGAITSQAGEPEIHPGESISAMFARGSPRQADNVAQPVSKKRREGKVRASVSNGHNVPSISAPGRRSGRLKGSVLEHDLPSEVAASTELPVVQVSAPPLPLRRRPMQEGESTLVPTSSSIPKFNIKRVRLLVRRPPPPLTNPRQRAPPAKHKSSLRAFLSSYTTLNGQDVDEETLQRQAAIDAAVYERTELFRKQGRFIPGTDIPFGFNAESQPSFTTHRHIKDHWDIVVESAIAFRKSRNKIASGQYIAGQIAAKIRAYWDGQEARKDRLKVQEERRLRALAKATIRMVTNEWKKAVFHIREQERLKNEAEEVRRGHEHLDAILDQSGQLLETQQGDLTRGDISRSRSSSMSLTFRGWGSENEEEEELDEDEDEDEDKGADDGEEREEVMDGLTEDEQGEIRLDERDFDSDDEIPSDADPEDTSHLLLAGPNLSHTHASVHSSHLDTSDVVDSVQDHPYADDETSDVDSEDGSSVFAVDELVNNVFDSSPQRLPAHSPSIALVEYGSLSPSPSPSLRSQPISSPIIENLHLEEEQQRIPRSPQPLPISGEIDIQSGNVGQRLQPNLDSQLPLTSPILSLSSNLLTQDSKSPLLRPASPYYHGSPRHSSHSPIAHSILPSTRNSLDRDEPSASPSSNVNTQDDETIVEPEFSKLIEELDEGDQGEVPEDLEDKVKNDEGKESTLPEDTPKENETGHGEVPDDSEHEPREDEDMELTIPEYLQPFAVAPVDWNPDAKMVPPSLLRGVLRPYQQSGLEWLASLHINNLNGILADEMGLGKTIQTIALLAHLACDRGIWGPHLIVVPTSVLLNWEMEFKKFLPGFKILSYHGSTKRRKELRQGWNDKHHFNVCITSYTLASRDAHIFKRKAWYYMILDEAHMIKNFKSQRWNILLMFRSFRRLLLTGTPLQNNLTELWALLQFLMSGANFANLKEFGEWFSNPLEKAIEMGNVLDDETMQRVTKLHTVLRPYLLRRLKRDVEKELPSKYEHLIMCPLSKRQRFLYDEFMSRAHTRDALQSGVYQKIANILMQLRKVCNHPDLFEVRPIVTSFAMEKSAITDFEIKELLLRRRLINNEEETVNLGLLGMRFIDEQNTPLITALETRHLEATSLLPFISEVPGEPPPKDMRTIAGFRKYSAYMQRANTIARWSHIGYLNRLRCNTIPIYSSEVISLASQLYQPIMPVSAFEASHKGWDAVRTVNAMVKSYDTRAEEMGSLIDRFAFVTPPVVALDMPRITLSGCETSLGYQPLNFDEVLHKASVKLQIAFPDPSLLQYDCGKLQELTRLLREKKAGGHRVLIFTQMTKILDILEIFLNFHGYLYLRLDGATKIEDRQYITERFNADARVFCFIASSRSGGVGINLTGADTVVFYDSDFNPQMDKQCEDRAHRIGQIRDVHIYRFVSQHTVEEALLRKANQKRSLDDLVIQKGEFDWRSLFKDESALSKALGEFEDTEDAYAAAVAAREEIVMEGADEVDFDGDLGDTSMQVGEHATTDRGPMAPPDDVAHSPNDLPDPDDDPEEEEGGSVVEYMILTVQRDYEYFRDWRL